MKDKQQPFFVNIGSSSLLVIFLVLCLATFAILSLSSAKSDHTFSERLAAHKQAYYEASERAETIVGEIDRILYETASGIDQTGLHDPDIPERRKRGLRPILQVSAKRSMRCRRMRLPCRCSRWKENA